MFSSLFSSLGPPVIINPPADMSVLSGANVSFYCDGLGAPQPEMTWLKDSKTIQPSKRTVVKTGLLQLFFVTANDVGKYTCVYKNKYGEDRKSAVLFVDGIEHAQCKFITNYFY